MKERVIADLKKDIREKDRKLLRGPSRQSNSYNYKSYNVLRVV